MKLTCCILIFITLGYSKKCQAQWLFGVNTGFNFPTNSNNLVIHENPNGNNTSLFSSYGKAINIGVSVTRFRGNIGFRFDVNYNLGGSMQTDRIIDSPAGNYRVKTNMSGRNLSFSPLIVLKYPGRKKSIYLFAGPIVATCKAINKITTVDYSNNMQWQKIETMTGNIALGIKAGIGFDYSTYRNSSVFIEIQNNSLNYKPAKLENEKTFPLYSKDIFYYHKNIDRSRQGNSINQIALSFSSLSIIVGFKIRL